MFPFFLIFASLRLCVRYENVVHLHENHYNHTVLLKMLGCFLGPERNLHRALHPHNYQLGALWAVLVEDVRKAFMDYEC